MYDQQASVFDKRAGLTETRCNTIFSAIKQLCHLDNDGMFVEIGCGTGELGTLLAGYYKNYIGIDLSMIMLDEFKQRHGNNRINLIHADCNKSWPIEDGLANVIFSSRAIHWLNEKHVVNESYRISKDDSSVFIVGRVSHPVGSWENELRNQCHLLLMENHLSPLDGESHLKRLCEEFSKRNAEVISPVVVCRWKQKRNIQQSILDWESKPGLAGTRPSEQLKKKIIGSLRNWANDRYNKNQPVETERQYVLSPIRLVS